MNEKEKQEFIQFLSAKAQEAGAKTEADVKKYIENLGEDGLKSALEEFKKSKAKKAKKAAHGAKLQYFKALKNQCAEDEEIVYEKRGGKVNCGCKKKQQGGEVPTEKCGGAVKKFKTQKKLRGGSLNGFPFSIRKEIK